MIYHVSEGMDMIFGGRNNQKWANFFFFLYQRYGDIWREKSPKIGDIFLYIGDMVIYRS